MATALATTISASAAAQSLTPKIFNRSPATTVQSYWTPERMAAAKPMELVVTGAPKRPTVAPLAAGRPGGGGGLLPGAARFRPFQASSTAIRNVVPLDGSFPGSHETFEYFPKYRTYPISTIRFSSQRPTAAAITAQRA
jgi:hypothetical protein